VTTWRSTSARAEAGNAAQAEQPSMLTMVRRGVMNRCPNCGEGKVFQGFLRVVPECEVCRAPLGQLRADDAPPYIVIFLTGHLLFPPIFWIEKAYEPPMLLQMAVWLPLFAVICTLLLRPAKGAVVGWMMRLGFADEDSPHRWPTDPGPSRDG
jgi:uncharacterized protein (DUF983 family)